MVFDTTHSIFTVSLFELFLSAAALTGAPILCTLAELSAVVVMSF